MASRAPEALSGSDRWLAVPVGSRPVRVRSDERLAARVRLVLETRPGDLPWNPAFGCALDEFIGKPVTASCLSEISSVVQAALRRWIRDVLVTRCEVRMLTDLGAGPGSNARAVPTAERSLVPFSLRATVEVDLELQTPDGPLSLQAILSP